MKIEMPPFEKAKVLVVGDVMLDQYWHGDVSRISPEAPVPIVSINKVEERIGGAGNVALNVSALGGYASFLGLVGADDKGAVIAQKLEQASIKNCLLKITGLPTISKLRVIGHSQQLIRLDVEQHFANWNEEEFFAAYLAQLAESNLVILSDYAKGTLRHSLKLIELARKFNKPILVDPKSSDFGIYRGATIITPNLNEFEAVVGKCQDEKDIVDKASQLLKQHNFTAVLITRGAQGMSLVCADKKVLYLPAKTREVYDVTGAGDTVIATLGVSLAAGEELFNAVRFANVAAGEVVKKLGASPVSISELRRSMQHQQDPWAAILDEEHLVQQIKDARLRGDKIVMTNGCFDILHAGHITYLEQAKALGDRLIVAINDDASVARLKGKERPINELSARMLVLAALGAVDWVVSFSEDTPENMIKTVSPDVLVKGGDWQVENIVGANHVLSYGGKVFSLPFTDGFSTTTMLKKIRDND